uniref:Uncharacterized protein n=1 Tax=Neogobius melanostomus TaxID=47308 RepID=A0A8C6SBZ9_9GOBI
VKLYRRQRRYFQLLRPLTPHGPVGLQTLLDLLVGVYQEFCTSPFAREKHVSGFLQWGECWKLKHLSSGWWLGW